MKKMVLGALLGLSVLFIQGCSSGSDTTDSGSETNTSSSSSTTPLAGVAAVGAPLAGATVILVDAAGTTKTVTADAEGAYTFDNVGAMTAPFLLKASGVVGGEEQTIYSALDEKPTPGETAVLNATPMTNAVVAQLSDGDPAKLFAAPTTMGTFIKPADMGAAKQKIMAVLEDQIKEQGLDPSKFDPFKTPFKANSSGFDKMLDLVKMQADASGNMTVIDKSTGIEKSISKSENLAAMTAKKMPPPPAGMKDLDFSKVKTLVDGMNSAWKSSGKLNLNQYFDSGFKSDGLNAVNFIAQITQGTESPEKIDGFVFGPCNVSVKVCEGTVALINKDGSFQQSSMPVKFDDQAKTWKWFGNQRDFEFYLNQEVVITTTLDSANNVTLDQYEGFRLWIDKTIGKKATLAIGVKPDLNSEASSWTTITTLNQNYPNNAECQNLRLDSKDNNDPCNHFIKFDEISSSLSGAKDAYIAGLLRFKISIYLNASDVSPSSESQFRPSFKLFDSTEKLKIQDMLKNSFKLSELGGTQITMPKGLSVNAVDLQLDSGGFMHFESRKNDLVKLGDTISASEVCEAVKKLPNNSNSLCTSNSAIASVNWELKDPGGSPVLIKYGYKKLDMFQPK